MTKEEMAQQFAEQKTEEVKEMLKAAFLKGYDQGALQTACSISIEGVEYYDLGLPSGTLWSEPIKGNCANKRGYIPITETVCYNEACMYKGLPTKEQCNELITFCRISQHGAYITGINGQEICVSKCYSMFCEEVDDREICLWIKSDISPNGYANTLFIKRDSSRISLKRHFAGYELPIMLTKKKEDIIEG